MYLNRKNAKFVALNFEKKYKICYLFVFILITLIIFTVTVPISIIFSEKSETDVLLFKKALS